MPARRKSTMQLEANGYFRKHPERRRVEPRSSGPVGNPPDYFDDHQRAAWNDLKSQAEPDVLQKSDRLLLELSSLLLNRSRTAPETKPRWIAELGKALREKGCPAGEVKGMEDAIFSGIRKRPSEDRLLAQCLGQMYLTPLSRLGR